MSQKHKHFFSLNVIWLRLQCRKWGLPTPVCRVAGLFFIELGGKTQRQVPQGCSLIAANVTFYVAGDNFVFQQVSAQVCVGRVTQSNSCSVKHLISFLPSYGSQQSGPKPRWQQIWGVVQQRVYSVRYADPQYWLTSSSDGWRLERSAAKCCRRCCHWVEKASVGVCSRERRPQGDIRCRLFW